MTKAKLNHIGVAVSSLSEAIEQYTLLLGKSPDHQEEVESEKVKTAFFDVGGSNIELLEATSDESPIAKFIAKKGRGGVHHICFEVDDIQAKINELKSAGLTLIDDEPRNGAHGMKVAFLHPKSTDGVLIELAEKNKE